MVAELVEAAIFLIKWHFDRLNDRLQEHFRQPQRGKGQSAILSYICYTITLILPYFKLLTSNCTTSLLPLCYPSKTI